MTCDCGEIETGGNFCQRCGKQHGHEDPESVLNFGQCRKCGSFQLRVTRSAKPWRTVSCKRCGYKAKTLEIWVRDAGYLQKAQSLLNFLGFAT